MSQYNYAGQPPYQGGAFHPQTNNPYPAGWNPSAQQGQGGFMPPPPPMRGFTDNEAYVESGGVKSNFGFDSMTVRAAFVRKVFSIVTVMLLVVSLMTALPYLHGDTMKFVRSNPSLYFVSYITFLIVYIALTCCGSFRRSFPINIIATAILTLSMGYMTMMICAYNNIASVLLCLLITTICCAGIVIFASQTKYDLTSKMGIIFGLSMLLMTFGFITIISLSFFRVTWMHTIYAGLASIMFMVYLAVDIQMIMGGRKIEISPEDYIYAAVQIFIDIVYIFWLLLSLFGSNNN